MNIGKIIAFITSGILLLFGVLFILAAFSPDNQSSTLGSMVTGGILILLGFIVIFILGKFSKSRENKTEQNITLNVDLPSDVNIERFKCHDCGAQLSMDNVKMIAGAPMVNCPYCDAAYQLTEEPKW